MWETIETLYHATIEAMSNKKRGEINNTQSRILKILIEGYMHFFSKHEICLSILTTISCNFQFVNTYI